MAIKTPDQPKQPTPPKQPRDIFADFNIWAQGRTGFTRRELAQIYANAMNLTSAERGTLIAKIQTEEDAIKRAEEEKKKAEEERKKKAVKESLTVTRTKYPKWWKDLKVWPITINAAGTWPVISNAPGWKTYVATIVFTVSDETDITLIFGVFGGSGAMNFGGTDEPRGCVIAMGDSPAPCGEAAFSITSTGPTAAINGFVTYYQEQDVVQKT